MVITSIRLHPREAHRAEALEILRSIQGPVLVSEGCLNCRVGDEQDEDHAISLSETWEDEHSLHQHLRSDLFNKILCAFDLSSMAPEVHFHNVSETHGLDLIEKIRSGIDPLTLKNRPERTPR